MKETGMVRRLDDLGRLVIPKEIRKMYRMKEGDSIEIFIKDQTICIRKYDAASPLYEQIILMCKILENKYHNLTFFTGENYIEKQGLFIDEKMLQKAQIHRSSFFENTKVFSNIDQRYSGYICPIVADGNYFGSLIMVFTMKECSQEELVNVQLFSDLLAAQQH